MSIGIILGRMESPVHKRLYHRPPNWFNLDATFFVTVCAIPRGINHFCHEEKGSIVLESIRQRHDKGVWYCRLALLMPDHIHLLLSFPGEKALSRVISEWKGWLGRYHRIPWQRNFFDHRLRSEQSLRDKGDYILYNPVRAGLVDDPKNWPYVWMPQD